MQFGQITAQFDFFKDNYFFPGFGPFICKHLNRILKNYQIPQKQELIHKAVFWKLFKRANTGRAET